MSGVTINTLKSATGANDSDAKRFLPYINKATSKYAINTPARVLAFLSQIGHESDHLRTTEEYASGAAYEGRTDLGNTRVGDGVKYKGRGIIQVTGRANYTAVGKALGIDAINHPELLSQPKYAVQASAWWWKNHGLNEVADTMDVTKPLTDAKNKNAFDKITKIINGGYTGLAQRQSNWESGKNAVLKFVQENPFTTALGFLTFIIGTTASIYYLVNRNKIQLAP
jgi:putative chitinase